MRNSHHEEEYVPLKIGVCDYSDHGNYPGDTHIYLKFHHKVLDHFFCDIFPVIKLSWVDTTVDRKMILLLVFLWSNPYESEHHLLCPLPSHYLQDCPVNIWMKAFVTSTPPFTLSIGSYSYASIAYLNPKAENSVEQDPPLQVTHTFNIPLLNCVIYRSKNKRVKCAICRSMDSFLREPILKRQDSCVFIALKSLIILMWGNFFCSGMFTSYLNIFF